MVVTDQNSPWRNPTRLVSIAALLRRQAPLPHPLLRPCSGCSVAFLLLHLSNQSCLKNATSSRCEMSTLHDNLKGPRSWSPGFPKLGPPRNRAFARPKLHPHCNMASPKVLVEGEAPYPSCYEISSRPCPFALFYPPTAQFPSHPLFFYLLFLSFSACPFLQAHLYISSSLPFHPDFYLPCTFSVKCRKRKTPASSSPQQGQRVLSKAGRALTAPKFESVSSQIQREFTRGR